MGGEHVDEPGAVDEFEVRLALGGLDGGGREFGGGDEEGLGVALAAEGAEELVDVAAADRGGVALGLDGELAAVAPGVDAPATTSTPPSKGPPRWVTSR